MLGGHHGWRVGDGERESGVLYEGCCAHVNDRRPGSVPGCIGLDKNGVGSYDGLMLTRTAVVSCEARVRDERG